MPASEKARPLSDEFQIRLPELAYQAKWQPVAAVTAAPIHVSLQPTSSNAMHVEKPLAHNADHEEPTRSWWNRIVGCSTTCGRNTVLCMSMMCGP
jgi:hypothetical protein